MKPFNCFSFLRKVLQLNKSHKIKSIWKCQNKTGRGLSHFDYYCVLYVTIIFYLFIYSNIIIIIIIYQNTGSIHMQHICCALLLSADALTVLIKSVVMVSEIDGSISDLFPCFSKPSVSHSIYLCQGTRALSSPHVLCFSHYSLLSKSTTHLLSLFQCF